MGDLTDDWNLAISHLGPLFGHSTFGDISVSPNFRITVSTEQVGNNTELCPVINRLWHFHSYFQYQYSPSGTACH